MVSSSLSRNLDRRDGPGQRPSMPGHVLLASNQVGRLLVRTDPADYIGCVPMSARMPERFGAPSPLLWHRLVLRRRKITAV